MDRTPGPSGGKGAQRLSWGTVRPEFPFPQRKVFYGWWMVAGGFFIQTVLGLFMFHAFGFYVERLEEEFNWSKTTFSLAFAMTRIESGVLGPIQGWAIDRFGPRIMIRLGIASTGIGFVLFSFVDSVTTFFLTYFLIAIGASMAGFVTLVVAVVNWFERKRSLALGLMSAGFSVGGLLVFLVVLAMDQYGWRATSLVAGVVIFVVGQIVATFIHHRPEDRGETIDGEPVPEAPPRQGLGSGPVVIPASEDFSTGEALRSPTFWFISIGHGAAVLIIGAFMVHLVLHLENLGYSAFTSSLIVLMMTAFQLVGQIGGGFLGDRLNKRVMLAFCMVGHVVALLLVTYAVGFWMIALFAIVNGIAWGTRGPMQQALRADYFGRRDFGKIMGFSSLIVMFGMMSGPIIAGAMADAFGDYERGFTVLAVIAGLGTIFFAIAGPPNRPTGPIWYKRWPLVRRLTFQERLA
ncbi:MAG: MFS transporter [Chloroflexi bacterium]|nr:MFS transporter [Chloroflexota bacterium]